MAVVLRINSRLYPLRRRMGKHTRTLRWTEGVGGCKMAPYVVVEVTPVHHPDCGIRRKRHGYACTCGASKMYGKLMEQR